MFEYARQALPYTQSAAEGYVWRNLEMRCFARTDLVIAEEYSDVKSAHKDGEHSERNGYQEPWDALPQQFRSGAFSPIISTANAFHNIGPRGCTNNGGVGAKCIPVFRTKFAFVFRVHIAAWFETGALCMQETNEGTRTGPFLLKSGLATEQLPDIEARFRNNPCVRVPTLLAAWQEAVAYVNTLDGASKRDLTQSRRRHIRRA